MEALFVPGDRLFFADELSDAATAASLYWYFEDCNEDAGQEIEQGFS